MNTEKIGSNAFAQQRPCRRRWWIRGNDLALFRVFSLNPCTLINPYRCLRRSRLLTDSLQQGHIWYIMMTLSFLKLVVLLGTCCSVLAAPANLTKRASGKVSTTRMPKSRLQKQGRDLVAYPRNVRRARLQVFRGWIDIVVVVRLEQELRDEALSGRWCPT